MCLGVYIHIYMFTSFIKEQGKYCGYPELCPSCFNVCKLALSLNSFFRQS